METMEAILYYHLVIYCHGESPFLIGKPSINAPFSMAILNNQRVPINWENNYG